MFSRKLNIPGQNSELSEILPSRWLLVASEMVSLPERRQGKMRLNPGRFLLLEEGQKSEKTN
jgi:hypothetical protein